MQKRRILMKFKNILLIALLTGSMMLSACGNKGGDSETPAHEHKWETPTYVWADDFSSCTAERVCSLDATHKETETVDSVYKVVTPAGCETDGLGRYTATFVNTVFTAQTQDKTIDPINHDWNEPTYEWTSDYSSCTATRVCKNNSTHIETETKNSECEVITPETMETDGEATYIVNFTNPAFETQVQNGILPKDVYAKKPHLSSDGKTIKYGLYPQTNVNDSSLIEALNSLTIAEPSGWYLYEGEYYTRVNATPYKDNYAFNNGVTITSGTLYWFKCEPIVWQVLSNNSGEYFLVSSVLLDAHCYYSSTSNRNIAGQTIYPNNYEYSDIREWLNGDFYGSAFALGSRHIQITNVDNSAATTDNETNNYKCGNTEDNVFLLSYKDMRNADYGFSSAGARYCRTTDWARARGAKYSVSSSAYQYDGDYWTRSPKSNSPYNVFFIYDTGSISFDEVTYAYKSVRPAMNITIA